VVAVARGDMPLGRTTSDCVVHRRLPNSIGSLTTQGVMSQSWSQWWFSAWYYHGKDNEIDFTGSSAHNASAASARGGFSASIHRYRRGSTRGAIAVGPGQQNRFTERNKGPQFANRAPGGKPRKIESILRTKRNETH